MKHLLSISLVSGLIAASALAAPSEKWVTEKASLNFDTFIRVKVPAQVVEAEDARIVGESAAFIQSLLYSGSKSLEFQGAFNSEGEVKMAIFKTLCPSEHEVDLAPLRHEGSKGERGFTGKLKPFTVSVAGKTIKGEAVKSFSVFLVCSKRI